MLAGFSQIPLTAANSVIATAALAKRYWPEEGKKVRENHLAFNIGLMNLIPPLFAGFFLTTFIIQLLSVFPLAVIGSMLFLVGIELMAFVRDSSLDWEFIPLAVTVLVSLTGNMAYGFVAGLMIHYLLQRGS